MTARACATPAAHSPPKSAARADYREVIEPGLNGKPTARRDLTFSALVAVFLKRHAIVAKPRTINELRWRLKQSEAKFGTVPLVEIEGMADEIAGFAVSIPEGFATRSWRLYDRHSKPACVTAYLTRNPAKLAVPNPMPAPREIRVFTADELTRITDELGGRCRGQVRRCDRSASR